MCAHVAIMLGTEFVGCWPVHLCPPLPQLPHRSCFSLIVVTLAFLLAAYTEEWESRSEEADRLLAYLASTNLKTSSSIMS